MRTENLAIVFVDIAGFTARTSSQTREENERLLRRFDDVVRPLTRAWDGRVVKTIGDAYLLTFRSPTNALLCCMGVLDRLAETESGTEAGCRFDVRAAVNVGDVRVDGGDVFGEAVNVASRIEGVTEAGEIRFSEAAYLAMTRTEVPSEEVGLAELKGIPERVRLYRVPRGGGPLPFGGLGLTPVRDRLQASAAAQVLEPVAAHARGLVEALPARSRELQGRLARAWDWWRVEVRRSRAVQVATLVALVALALVVWAAWPKPEPATPWQRFQRDLGL
ncbi:MAG TPA: adenylate/guanylate cyclase domain-containing protein [Anaeromyxobacteraceae bacterium]|nr:adenylate/guanylate cyclase domain-containing protein [Anaeromyxobacteraceae bacterium]